MEQTFPRARAWAMAQQDTTQDQGPEEPQGECRAGWGPPDQRGVQGRKSSCPWRAKSGPLLFHRLEARSSSFQGWAGGWASLGSAPKRSHL